ncbi:MULTISPECIES: helix-turn-helix domain-containing protein [unclassified Streptomyces]|uniref:helix-turn-helix domain-containing protein n=1 Tax=unclassified Streptomyces TaxID=2593676 RepID=UPI0037F265F7
MNAAAEARSGTSRGHRNAPLNPEGRLRLCLRVDDGHPIAHVAAEAGISRRCLAKWYARWLAHGEDVLTDRSSPPIASPNRTSEDIADLVEALRRQTKYGPARLAAELQRGQRHAHRLVPLTAVGAVPALPVTGLTPCRAQPARADLLLPGRPEGLHRLLIEVGRPPQREHDLGMPTPLRPHTQGLLGGGAERHSEGVREG